MLALKGKSLVRARSCFQNLSATLGQSDVADCQMHQASMICKDFSYRCLQSTGVPTKLCMVCRVMPDLFKASGPEQEVGPRARNEANGISAGLHVLPEMDI